MADQAASSCSPRCCAGGEASSYPPTPFLSTRQVSQPSKIILSDRSSSAASSQTISRRHPGERHPIRQPHESRAALRACPQTLHAQKVLFPNQQGHNRWFPGYREDAHTAIVPSPAFGDCARASAARRATAGGRRIASFLATTDLVVNQKVRWKGRGFVDMLLGLVKQLLPVFGRRLIAALPESGGKLFLGDS